MEVTHESLTIQFPALAPGSGDVSPMIGRACDGFSIFKVQRRDSKRQRVAGAAPLVDRAHITKREEICVRFYMITDYYVLFVPFLHRNSSPCRIPSLMTCFNK